MTDNSATLAGQCSPWPSKQLLVRYLREAGLDVIEGQYSIRVADCEHFVFQHYGNEVFEPLIEADAETAEALLRDAKRVSMALAVANVRHRFELYDGGDNLIANLQHDWGAES